MILKVTLNEIEFAHENSLENGLKLIKIWCEKASNGSYGSRIKSFIGVADIREGQHRQIGFKP